MEIGERARETELAAEPRDEAETREGTAEEERRTEREDSSAQRVRPCSR